MWFKWNATINTWIPLSNNWLENYTEPLANVDHVYYYLWTNDKNTERFIHLNRVSCAVTCNITSFEYVKTPVNVNDSTFAFEGSVAYTKAAGNLKISFGSNELIITDPQSPQVFSLKGLKADGTTGHLIAQFEDDASCIADSTVTAPEPTSGIVAYDSELDPSHYSPSHATYIHGTNVTLTPSVLVTDSFAWTDTKGAIKYSSRTGGDNHYTVSGFGHDTTLILYYTEFNDPPYVDDNMMGNGYYEMTTAADENTATSQYKATSDYKYTGVWGGLNSKHDVYDNGYSNQNGLFGITTNANTFWKRMAHVSPKKGTYLAVYDGDDDEKVAWRASTAKNPRLTLTKGTTYMFSFWVANVNNYGEMSNQGNKNGAVLQFKIEYTDTNGDPHEAYLGEEIDLSNYMDNLWHQNSSTFTSEHDANDVTISVVDLNDEGISIGNDFALDDIRFRAVSIQSGTVRTREQFTIEYVEPKTTPVNLQVEWVTKPACGKDTCTLKVTFRYPNITMHDIKLTLKDLTIGTGSYGTLVNNVTIGKTPIPGNPDSTDYVCYFTSGTFAGATSNAKILADGKKHSFKAELVVKDVKDVNHGGYTNASDLQAPAIPVLEIKRCEVIAPDCSGTTYNLEVDVDYTALSGKDLKYYIADGLSEVKKATRSIDYDVELKHLNNVSLLSLPADGKEHTLKVTTGDDLDCIATTKFTAPMANTITAFAVEPIQPDCDVETYTLRATWTVTKPADGVYDALMIKVGTATPYEIPITASNATGDNAKFDIPITYTIGDDHPAIKAYMKERGATCYETGIYSDPTTPRMTIGDTTYEDIECNKETFDLVVPVTYTYQHGRMWAWIDDKTSEMIEITASGNCKTGGAYQGYLAESTSSRTTYIVFNDVTLSGDHKVSVECDGEHSCHRTKALGTAKDFIAPVLPFVDRVFKSYSTPTCNDPYTTLTFDFKYANQPAGTIEMWVDDDKTTGHMITLVSASGDYTPDAALKTIEKQKIKFIPADSLDTHILHIKSGTCDETFTLPQVPFMPKIEDVSVSWPSTLSCGASDKYTATVTVTSSNCRNATLCVSLNDGTPQQKSPNSGSQTFTFTDLPANGSSNTVKAWFKCVGESCYQTESFTAPALPKASVVTPISMPTVAACDQPTFDLTFDLKYTYQDGELQVWVARAGDATKYGLKTFTASASDGDGKYVKLDKDEQTKTITLTGLPSDGRSDYKLYFKFNESGYCGYSSPIETNLAAFPRSPTITAVAVSGVPNKVADCTVETYDATVTVTYQYTSGEKIMIAYTDKDDVAKTYGPVTLTGSPQAITLDDVFDDIGKGAKSLEVYFQKSPVDFSSCHHSATYTAPSNSSINSGYVVTIDNKSTCGNRKYNLSGTITFSDDATDDLIISFPGVRDTTIEKGDCDKTGTPFTMTGLTAETAGKTLIAKFKDQPDCTAASKPLETVGVPGFDVDNMSFTTPGCDETTTTLKFDLKYTYQSGSKLYVWEEGEGTKHEVTFEKNKDNELTISGIEIPGVSADSATHTLHVEFEGGRCPAKTFTTPVAPFSGKISNIQTPSISDESCGSPTYSVSVTFDVSANSAGQKVIATCKSKSKEMVVTSGTNTIKITGIERKTPVEADDVVIELYFKDKDNCNPRHSITFDENPFKPIPTFSLKDIAPKCYPADKFAIECETDVKKIKYKVNTGEEKEATLDASKKFEINTSTWTAGTYTITAYGISDAGCNSAESSKNLIIRKQPKITIDDLGNACDDATSTTLKIEVTDAISYNYYIVGETELLETPVSVTADGEYTLGLNIVKLNVGDAAKSYTLKMVANSENCVSDTVDESFTIYPLPELAFDAIEPACHPASSVEVTYTQTNTKSFTYTVKTKDGLVTKISDETVTVDATQKFTITTDTWAAGDYTLTAVAESNNGCTTNTDPINFTILPKPAIEAIGVGSLCKGGTAAYLTLNAKNATHYRYYIVGKTALSDKIAIGASTVDLPSDLEPRQYKFKLVALSETCHSDTAECDFNIWPLPTFTFKDEVAHDCHPSSSISVGYKSTDADKYSYTLTKEGAGSPARTVTDQPASGEGIIVLNTSGLAAGTYNLEVTAKSGHDCELATPATKVVTIYDQPTVDITSVENHCEGSAEITVNYTTEYASNYTYEVVGTTLSGHGAAEASGSFKIDISNLEDGDYKLRMHVTSAHAPLTCDGTSDEYDFTIWAVPEVGFITPLPIKEGVASVTVTLQLQDAETYDWRFMNGSTELESGNNVPAGQTTVTLTTGSLDEGTYSLFVTPKTSHCAGEEREVHVVVNNKPTINFTEPDIVCAGSSTLNVEYSTSLDATDLYYTIKQGATTVVSEQHVDLTATASPLPVNISGLTYGTYTLTGYVKSALETGDVSSTDFTLIAVPTLNKVTQNLAFIGCEETYDATIKVNIFNAAGRKIYAKYTDDGEHTLHVETSAGDPTATINLTDLTHTDLSEKHEVKVYVDGFEDCGLTVGYDEPKLKTITKDFEVTPLPKSCGDEKFTITGTVVANCNEGKIVVEYNDTYKDIVDASTSGSDFTIADIPAGGGVTKLKAYFQGKTCGVVESAEFAEPTKPEASIAYTPYVTPLCDVTTFNLEFTLDYTYQEAGTLTVWVDEDHKNTYNSADSKYEVLAAKTQLTGTIEGLPADGRTGQKLYFEFSGSHSCKGSIDLDAFPQTPLITGTDIDNANIPQVVPGVDGTYPVTVTVTYELAIGERIVLEYFDKDDQAQHAYSTTAVTGSGSYEFNLTFNDVAVTGDRFVNAYFEGSSCTTGGTHTDTYTAPSNSSAKFESLELTNISSCDALLYNLTGTVSFVGAAVGDLIIEFDANHADTIPEADCVAGENIPFAINGVDVPIPAEGQQLKVYFSDLQNNKSYSEEVYQPVIPTMAISDSAYSTPACNSTTTTLTFVLTYLKQQGNLHVAVDGVEQGYTLSDDLKLNDETTRSLTVTVADQPADMAVRQLTVWFDGDKSCSRTVTLPQAPFGPQIIGGEAVVSNFTCGSDVYDMTVTVTTANHLGKDLTLICHEQTKVVPVTGSPMSVLFTDINRTIDNTSDDFIELYFADASNAADCVNDHTKIAYIEPAKPALEADVKVDTVFTCGNKQYNFTVTIASENQPGTCYVLDSIVGGEVHTKATHEGSYNGSDEFSLALPATNEQHFVIVRYPATSCEIISPAIDINTYTKPKPLISLTAIDRLCNSETELLLPFSITQGDIAEATLTLTDSKGKTVITAADLTINDDKDTLSYALTSQLAAGKYTATVEAHDTLDCETSASQSIEFALDGVVFSKWTDVLLVDNADGAFTGYQWYENGVQLDGQTGQVLYLPEEGMVGKSYYCQLQTADGTIYTCEDVFDALPRSADNPKQPTANHITVLPNRVAANGAVTVRQSANENLHLILMSATGKRVAEYTQQESAKLVTMPGVQGIYLLRIEAESDAQTVKIVVY